MHEPKLPRAIDPGKFRGFAEVTSDDGFLLICAIDHLLEFAVLLDADPGRVPFSEIVERKAELIRSIAPATSALLLDARYGLQSVVAGAVPRDVGIVLALEDETYQFPTGPRGTVLRAGWDVRKVKRAGAGMAKMLWFYRPDLDQEVARRQRELLADVQRQCYAESIPLIVEPIWYAVAGEDPRGPEWRAARNRGVLESARTADGIGVDMLKIEFPGRVGSDAEIEAAVRACEELDASISVPWVLLSAGVTFDEFALQLEISCTAGASGYMAGRSLWSEAVSRDPDARQANAELALRRLAALNDITRTYGRAFVPTVEVGDAIRVMPDGWYTTWA